MLIQPVLLYAVIMTFEACFIILLVYTHAHTNALSHSKVLATLHLLISTLTWGWTIHMESMSLADKTWCARDLQHLCCKVLINKFLKKHKLKATLLGACMVNFKLEVVWLLQKKISITSWKCNPLASIFCLLRVFNRWLNYLTQL